MTDRKNASAYINKNENTCDIMNSKYYPSFHNPQADIKQLLSSRMHIHQYDHMMQSRIDPIEHETTWITTDNPQTIPLVQLGAKAVFRRSQLEKGNSIWSSGIIINVKIEVDCIEKIYVSCEIAFKHLILNGKHYIHTRIITLDSDQSPDETLFGICGK